MLLATSVTSSTFVHGHSGGNLSHQHDPSNCSLSHSIVPATFHDGHDGDVSLSAVDVHRHGCLVLLGAITYQPMPSEPSGSHEKSPNGWETIVAVSAVQSVRGLSKSITVAPCWSASFDDLSVDCICSAKQCGILSPGVVLAFPLCDRARHERSGVQLT